nr:ribonuclease inhibitor-like [Paramormyrops kingsleyae]
MAHSSNEETQTSLADLLEDYLEELSDEELKKFKSKLSRTKYKELKPLPRGQVKGLDRTDLAEKMISCYMEAGALEVTLEILKNMNLNDLAERLKADMQKCNQAGSELGDVSDKILLGIPHYGEEILSFCLFFCRLSGCRVTEEGCFSLASALRLNPTHLRELDLSYNHPGDSGVKLLSAVLEDPSCKLEKLQVGRCELTENCCEVLASALRSNFSPLRELDLSANDLQDSGVKLLSAGLGDLHCKLEILRLSGCRVTEEGCSSLASTLRSNHSHLRELDLSYNHPGDSGVKLLSAVLEDPSCKLEKLNVDHSGECRTRPGLQKCKCVCMFLLIIPLILCYGFIHTVVVMSVAFCIMCRWISMFVFR